MYRFPTPPEVRTHPQPNSWEPEPSGHSSVPRLAAHGFERWVKLLGLSHHVAPGEVSGSCQRMCISQTHGPMAMIVFNPTRTPAAKMV